MIKKLGRANLFEWILFLYFVTLHADQLNVVLGGYTVRLNNLLALGFIVFVLIRLRGQLLSINNWLVYPLLVIAVSMICSLCLSPYPLRCSFYLGWYGLTVFCYVLLPYLIMKLWDAHKVFSIYQASFLCVGCYALLQLLLPLVGIHDPFVTQSLAGKIVRPNAFCFEPSFYALYMTPFVFFYNAQFLASQEKKPLWPIWGVNLLYLISTSTAIFFAYSLFFLLLIVSPGVIDHKKVLKFFAAFCGSVLGIFLFFPFMLKHVFLKFFFHGFMTHHSFYERWIGLENGWHIFMQHPLFGVGLGGYSPYLMDAYLRGDTTFSYMGMHALIGEVANPVKLFEAMNVFTELLASLGVIGLSSFGLLLYGFLGLAKRAFVHNRQLTYCLLLSCVVTLVIVQFNQGLFRTYVWVHFALVCAYLNKLVEQHEPSSLHLTS